MNPKINTESELNELDALGDLLIQKGRELKAQCRKAREKAGGNAPAPERGISPMQRAAIRFNRIKTLKPQS